MKKTVLVVCLSIMLVSLSGCFQITGEQLVYNALQGAHKSLVEKQIRDRQDTLMMQADMRDAVMSLDRYTQQQNNVRNLEMMQNRLYFQKQLRESCSDYY